MGGGGARRKWLREWGAAGACPPRARVRARLWGERAKWGEQKGEEEAQLGCGAGEARGPLEGGSSATPGFWGEGTLFFFFPGCSLRRFQVFFSLANCLCVQYWNIDPFAVRENVDRPESIAQF